MRPGERVSDAIRALVEERDNLRKMASVEIQAAQGMARAAALALAERVKIYGIENTITARPEIVFALLGLDEERDRLRSETALQPRSIGGVSHG